MVIIEIVVPITRKGLDATEVDFPVDAQVLGVRLQDTDFCNSELVITVAGANPKSDGTVKRRILVLPPGGNSILSSLQLDYVGEARVEGNLQRFYVFVEKLNVDDLIL